MAVDQPVALVRLPLVLVPDRGRSGTDAERVVPRFGLVRGSERDLRRLPRPLAPVGGVPRQSVDACRNSIAAGAKPHGAIRVEAVSAGTPSRVGPGVTGAPIEARIIYARMNQVQVRQARITCHVSARGQVVALL
jgi:hypothetical protein